MIPFKVGKVYVYTSKYTTCQFVCISRTPKTAVFASNFYNKCIKKHIKVSYNDVEYITPFPNKNCLLMAYDTEENYVA